MARLVRKNLMVDPVAVSELAQRRGTTESQAVREAVEMALGATDMTAALEGLHRLGAFADFETLFPSLEPPDFEVEKRATARRRSKP